VTRLYHRKVLQFLVDSAEIAEEVAEPSEDDDSAQPEAEGTDEDAAPSPDQ
jgi:hypothetical protein